MQEVLIDEVSPDVLLAETYIASLFIEEKLEVSFLFRSSFSNTKLLREIIIKLLEKAWVPLLWQNRFMLIVDELNNNAIEYGSTQWDLNHMRVYLSREKNTLSLSIEVEDSWKWAGHKTAQEMRDIQSHKLDVWFAHHASIRGRGLFLIIFKLVDSLYFADSTTGWLIVGVKKILEISPE